MINILEASPRPVVGTGVIYQRRSVVGGELLDRWQLRDPPTHRSTGLISHPGSAKQRRDPHPCRTYTNFIARSLSNSGRELLSWLAARPDLCARSLAGWLLQHLARPLVLSTRPPHSSSNILKYEILTDFTASRGSAAYLTGFQDVSANIKLFVSSEKAW